MKKFLSVLLVLALVLSCVAFAESPSNIAYLFDEVSELLFDTHNVTVLIDAEFTYDGLTFKKMDLDYKQDDIRSFLSYLLDTVSYEGGEPVKSGYTVWGTGATAYSVNVGKSYYQTHPTKVSDTLLLKNTKLTLAADLAKAVAVTAENTLDVNEKNGDTYRFVSGALPEFVNKTAYFLVSDYIRSRLYMDIYHEARLYESLSISYEKSWSDCVAARFEELYGTALKENYYEDPAEYERYMVAENAMSQLESYVRTLYNSGYAVLRLDGSYEWYPTLEEVYRALGQIDLTFENDRAAFCDFYRMKTGETLSDADYEILVNSPSDELWQAIGEISTEMYDYYLNLVYAQEPEAVSAIVKEDGSVVALTSFAGSGYGFAKTLTETVVENIAMASLTGMELNAQTDENGKLAAGSGTVDFDVQYTDGSVHKLTVSFNAAVTDRGSTKVSAEFKPEELGLETAEQYYNAQVIDEGYSDNWWLDLVRRAPETIIFNGKEYRTGYEMYR